MRRDRSFPVLIRPEDLNYLWQNWRHDTPERVRSGKPTMEDEDIALNSVLGLELNRVFFAVSDTANKQKIIEFARQVLQSEREELADSLLPEGPAS